MSDIVQKIYDEIEDLKMIYEIHMGRDVWDKIEEHDRSTGDSEVRVHITYSKDSKIAGTFRNMEAIIVDYFPPNTYFLILKKYHNIPFRLAAMGSSPPEIFDSIEEYEAMEVLEA